MRRILQVVAIGVLGAAAAACGASAEAPETGSTIVQGTVSSQLSIDNARAVAIGTDGRTFWAYLDAHGDFRLRLPVGQSYRIVIANQIAGGGGQRAIGHLVLRSSGGGTTRWLGANEPIVVDLGRLRPVDSGGIKTACSGCGGEDKDESDDADHDDDYECHDKGASKPKPSDKGSCGECTDDDESDSDSDKGDKGYDDDEECNVCKDGNDDKELEPSKKPGKECEDKDADKGEKKKGDYDDEKPCAKKGGGDKSTPDSTGGGKSGSKCQVKTECSSECSCVASKCAPI